MPNGEMHSRFGRSLLFGTMDDLGRMVVSQEYRDTGFPTEAQLCLIHGVSRSVIREAVKMLAAKGLLGGRPRQGTFVQPVESWNLFDTDVLRWFGEVSNPVALLRQLNELRIVVEPKAAALAALRASLAQRENIAACIKHIVESDEHMVVTPQARAAFHTAVLNASNNPFYAQFSSVAAIALTAFARLRYKNGEVGTPIEDYAAVCDAIAVEDPARAAASMTHLIERSGAAIDTGCA